MKAEVKVPGVGESITSGLLASWSVADGGTVIEGQALFELETDKTTIDVTAPATGILRIAVPAGTEVSIGQVVAVVDTAKAAAADNGAAPSDKPGDDSVAGATVPRQRATPAAKAAAASAGISLAAVIGSGRDGMITRADIDAPAGDMAEERPIPGLSPFAVNPPGETSAGGQPTKPEVADRVSPSVPPAGGRGDRPAASAAVRKPLSRIRKVIAANLERTRDELVLLTTFNEVDMSEVKSLRARHGEEFQKRHGVKLGFMSFFLKAAATALQDFPGLNAHIEGDDVVYPDGVHISVAVSTPRGLVTPVVRHVELKNHAEIESEIAGFSVRAAEKTLLPDDLMGGTFTITNGGVFGSMLSTPLPSPGQSAILGMHAVIDRPVAIDGQVEIRPMMYLALSYDHRLVDGREAVGCLKRIRDLLESPGRLLLGI